MEQNSINTNEFVCEFEPSKKIAILCVDDESFILHSLQSELADLLGRKYVIEFAENGPEALELFTELLNDGYDIPVVISDYIMPGMKGDELLKRIYQLSPSTLNMLLTGQATLEGVANAINQAHLFKYIEKPWRKEDIRAVVTEAVELYYRKRKISLENNTLLEEREILQSAIFQKDHEIEQVQAELGTTEKIIAIGEIAENLSILKEYERSMAALKSNIALLKELPDTVISNDRRSVNTYLHNEKFICTKTNAAIEKMLIAIRERNKSVLFDETNDIMLDLNECIANCISQFTGNAKIKLEIKTDFGKIPSFRCNPRQIEYIFSNLLMFLYDSIKDPYQIRIKTIRRHHAIVVLMEGSGSEIRNAVFNSVFHETDFDQDHLQRIFQLAVICQIVRDLKGEISLKNHIPSGIAFTIELPVAIPAI